MAKAQKRGNREAKKPKQKKVATPEPTVMKGIAAGAVGTKKKG